MLKTVSSVANAIGALNYKGTWNAATNDPAIASGVGTQGDYYVVSVAGATNLDGITNWGIGDWATFNGSVWQRVEGGADGNFVNLEVTGDSGFGAAPNSSYRINALDTSAVVMAVSRDGTDGDAIQIFNGLSYGTRCLGLGVSGSNGTINNQYGNIEITTSSTLIGKFNVNGFAPENGKGIDFSATAGTGTSELLDDYEEGTWTPSYTASGLSVTHDNQSGSYTKIGNTVFFTLFIGTDAVSGGGGSQLNISGLPYSGSGASSSIVGLANSFNVSENDTKWAILNGSTSIALYNGASNSAGVLPSSALATFSNTNRLYVSGTYQTA
jgi:hypothetical protein